MADPHGEPGVHVSIVSLVIKSGSVVSALTIAVAGLLGFDPRAAVTADGILMIKLIGLVIPALLIPGRRLHHQGFRDHEAKAGRHSAIDRQERLSGFGLARARPMFVTD